MKYRQLGRTGLKVSALGFGCGAVGGLLVKGEHKEMMRVIGRAIELGVNYFDTAAIYGDGKSETNLGLILEALKAEVLVGTKVRLLAEEMDDIESAVVASVESSLKRLRRDRIDLIQLHNYIAQERQPERHRVGVDDVQTAIHAFRKLQRQGKIRYWGINGLGETRAVHQAVAQGKTDTVQCCFNLINPSAGVQVSEAFPFEDYEQIIDRAAERQVGVIAIRVLAGGALSGSAVRHPNAAQTVEPIATGSTLVEDVALAQRFAFLVQEGYTGSLVEAAIRFVIGKSEVSTTLIGISNMEQLEQAVTFANRGPLPSATLDHLNEVWINY